MLQIEKISSESNIIITQDSYDNTIDSTQFGSIRCPSCAGVGFTRHAFYKRKVTLPNGETISLRVLRVKCAHCNKTHAVLPLAIIPYKRITYMTATRIINLKNRKAVIDFLDNNLDIDENMIYRIKQQFKHRWKQILISLDITRINVESIKVIIQNQNVQFMQIKRTICSLNTITT